jgi:hypothetical protein
MATNTDTLVISQSLLIQHGVERVLNSATKEHFQIVLESGFVGFNYFFP